MFKIWFKVNHILYSEGRRKPLTIPEGKQQINFNAESETVFKLKKIALIKGVPVSQVYTHAFQSFADQYEKENGKIKLPKK